MIHLKGSLRENQGTSHPAFFNCSFIITVGVITALCSSSKQCKIFILVNITAHKLIPVEILWSLFSFFSTDSCKFCLKKNIVLSHILARR